MFHLYKLKNFICFFFFRGSYSKGLLLLLFCWAALSGCGHEDPVGEKDAEFHIPKPEPPVSQASSGILLPLDGSADEIHTEKLIDLRNPFLPPFAYVQQKVRSTGEKNILAAKSFPDGNSVSPNATPFTTPCLTGIFQQDNHLLALVSWGPYSGVFAQGETLRNGYQVARVTPQTVILHKGSTAQPLMQQGTAAQSQPERLTLRIKEDGII